jgi:hypothetical protein
VKAQRPVAFLAAVSAILAAGSGCSRCNRNDNYQIEEAPPPMATLKPDAAPLNVSTVPTSEVQKMVNPQNLPAYNGPTGSLEGTILVSGPPASPTLVSDATYAQCPGGKDIYGKSFREGQPNEKGERALGDAIVVATGYAGFYVQEKKEAEEVTIEGCGFSKRTVVMTYGQRLEVKNLTKEFWTPELAPQDNGVMMMAPPGGDAVKLYPKKAGRYLLVDHDRKYVGTDVMVLQHPLHAVSDLKGHFRIDGIPVGKIRVTVSHPHIQGTASTLETVISANVVSPMNLVLTHKEEALSDAGGPDAFVPYPGLH